MTSDQDGAYRLRWFVGVPICANIMILSDVAGGTVVLSVIVALGVSLLQLVLDSHESALRAGLSVAGLFALFFLTAFAAVGLIFHRNRYIALYRFDSNSIYRENMTRIRGPLSESFHCRPFPVEPSIEARRGLKKTVSWSDVREVSGVEWMRTIILRGEKGDLMRIYCPNTAIYQKALAAVKVKEKVDEKVKGS